VPEEIVGFVARMVVTDPKAMKVAKLQSFVGATKAKAVSVAVAHIAL
jgi:hypothetical protein